MHCKIFINQNWHISREPQIKAITAVLSEILLVGHFHSCVVSVWPTVRECEWECKSVESLSFFLKDFCPRDAWLNRFLLPHSACQWAGRWARRALFVLTPRPCPVCVPWPLQVYPPAPCSPPTDGSNQHQILSPQRRGQSDLWSECMLRSKKQMKSSNLIKKIFYLF